MSFLFPPGIPVKGEWHSWENGPEVYPDACHGRFLNQKCPLLTYRSRRQSRPIQCRTISLPLSAIGALSRAPHSVTEFILSELRLWAVIICVVLTTARHQSSERCTDPNTHRQTAMQCLTSMPWIFLPPPPPVERSPKRVWLKSCVKHQIGFRFGKAGAKWAFLSDKFGDRAMWPLLSCVDATRLPSSSPSLSDLVWARRPSSALNSRPEIALNLSFGHFTVKARFCCFRRENEQRSWSRLSLAYRNPWVLFPWIGSRPSTHVHITDKKMCAFR